jgi:hypothetical protein
MHFDTDNQPRRDVLTLNRFELTTDLAPPSAKREASQQPVGGQPEAARFRIEMLGSIPIKDLHPESQR